MKTKVQTIQITAAGKCDVQYDLLDDKGRPVKGARLQYTTRTGAALFEEAQAYVDKAVAAAAESLAAGTLATEIEALARCKEECAALEAKRAALAAEVAKMEAGS